MLDGERTRALADLCQQRFALRPPGLRQPDLDEFVRGKRSLDFCRDAIGQPGGSDADDGVKVVRARPKRAAKFGAERFFHTEHCKSKGCVSMAERLFVSRRHPDARSDGGI